MTKSELFKNAHRMVKEIRKEHPEVNYHFQIGICMKYLLEEERLEREIDFNEFFDFYQNNPKLFGYLFQKENILAKNGFETKCQKYEAEITTSTFQILDYQEMEDVKQETLLRIMEYFEKYKTLKYRYIGNLYRQVAYNSCKSYSRQKKHFRVNKDPNLPLQKMEVDCHYNDYNTSITNMDIERLFEGRKLQIIKLLNAGYTKVEIAPMLKVSRQTIYKDIEKIKDVILFNGIAYGLQ